MECRQHLEGEEGQYKHHKAGMAGVVGVAKAVGVLLEVKCGHYQDRLTKTRRASWESGLSHSARLEYHSDMT